MRLLPLLSRKVLAHGLVASAGVLTACTSDGPPAGCTVHEDLGAIDLGHATAAEVTQQPPAPPGNPDAKLIFLRGAVDAGDLFELALWDSYGAFGDGDVTTGTFVIGGADAVNISCGICARLLGDIQPDGSPKQRYLATSGSVVLTSVTGNLVGSAADLVFEEIDEASTDGTPLTDGCTAHIAKARFDVAIAPLM